MNVWIGSTQVTLSDADVLGVGGEACVYKHGNVAVKLYHPPAPGLAAAERKIAKEAVEKKLVKVSRFPSPVPPELVAPLELAKDRKGHAVGFTMPLVGGGAEPVLRLTQRRWRENLVPNARVVALYRKLADVLTRLHGTGIVFGDLNDANVLFRPRPDGAGADEQVFLIDADSVQFGAFPCVVAHERYLDPRLYGRDLSAAPLFTPNTDWYALAVMAFSSLLYVHPYGGILDALPTMLRRAEARHSVLRSDVTYPKAAVHYRILPDDVLHWFGQVFDHDLREPLPPGLYDLSFTKCACGQEHARVRCPACFALGVAAQLPAAVSRGRCRAQRVFRTTGSILDVATHGGLKYAYEEDGVVRREDLSRVMEQALSPGMRFAVQGRSTWVGMGDHLVRIHGEAIAERTATGRFENEPMFGVHAGGCFRLDHEWLMDAARGTRAGQVFPGQTWFATGERLGFGYWRAGRHVHAFLFRTDRPGLVDVALPPRPGRLTEVSATFDEAHALVVRTYEDAGVVTRAMDLVDASGRVLGSIVGHPDSVRMLASISGKALFNGRVLCATDQGLLAVKVDQGVLVEGTLFADTEPFVQSGATILPGPGGSVYVVTTREITQLTLM